MEKEFCTVQTGDKVKCYERGIAYKKIAEEFQEEYPAKIVLALVLSLIHISEPTRH